MAGVHGFARPHSAHLRRGLAETLIYLGTTSHDIAGEGGQARADRTVASILAAANSDATGQLWSSLGDVLELLAEASPDRFLDAVDRGLAGTAPPLARLFNMSDNEGPFGPAPETTGLLWALETLAWSSDHLARTTNALARLDALDPGVGKWANRPGNSLRAIFLPWHPGTSAPLAQRLKVLDTVRRAYPVAAWRLLLSLLPRLQDWAEPTHEPTRRDWPLAARPATYAEVFEHAERLAQWLVEDAGQDATRWFELVDALPTLPPSARETMLRSLRDVMPSPLTPEWVGLGEKIRATVAEHRRSPGARWRLPDDEIQRLDSIAEAMRSPDAVRAGAWLFESTYPALPIPMADDLVAYRAELDRQRTELILALAGTGGFTSLERLAGLVKEPFLLGYCVAATTVSVADDERAVDNLRSDDHALSLLGAGYIRGRHSQGWAWTEATLLRISSSWGPSEVAKFLMTLQPVSRAVWDWAVRLGPETEQAYWATVDPRFLEDQAEAVYVAGRLVAAGRAPLAIDVLAGHLEALGHPGDDQPVIDVLGAAVTDPGLIGGDAVMLGWAVARLLDFLEKAPSPELGSVAQLEFSYLPLLRHGDRPKLILHRELATDPAFFIEVLSLAFRAEGEAPRELTDRDRLRAQLAYELLDSWETAPGVGGRDEFDPDALRSWVNDARALAVLRGRPGIAAQQIGRALRYVPNGSDGVWPAEVVRDLVQELQDEDLELGLEIEIQNSRGATWRGLTDGGHQERELAASYRNDAARLRDRWTRMTALLSRVADAYDSQARLEDQRADLTQDTWS
jgi:hypothetical protein